MSVLLLPERDHLWGPLIRKRRVAALALYAALLAVGCVVAQATDVPGLRAFALGLTAPGGGFLFWAAPGGAAFLPHLAMSGVAALLFVGALFIWFAAGAVVAPVAVWLGAALLAAFCGDGAGWPQATRFAPLVLGAFANAGLIWAILSGRRALARRAASNRYLARIQPAKVLDARRDMSRELSADDLSLMRLVLDRALQPVEDFEGFEWIDQYQTAAVRYQLNFMSYALSVAQAERVPAFGAYLSQAQKALLLKQLDPRIWGYWRRENLLGHLRASGDPIPSGNIMFTGFVATQIALFQAASGDAAFDAPGSLSFVEGNGVVHAYSYEDLLRILADGFKSSEFGLLPCEPNWIYPLCNMISACAIRAADARRGGANWAAVAPSFRAGLESDFIAPDGTIIPFLSSLAGASAPITGGAVMQAFPCLFLNALFPDIAERQWLLARRALSNEGLRRAIWPIDTGNYRFSRAAGYAACAAAATELGDGEVAARLFAALEEDCPRKLQGGVSHRPRASLWAHAVELLARVSAAGSLRRLVVEPAAQGGPFIAAASYPDILPARAVAHDGALHAVLYPGRGGGVSSLVLGGLAPGRAYVVRSHETRKFDADAAGEARLDLLLDKRIEFVVHPDA